MIPTGLANSDQARILDAAANNCQACTVITRKNFAHLALALPGLVLLSLLAGGCATVFDDPNDVPFESEPPRTVAAPTAPGTSTSNGNATVSEVEEFVSDSPGNLADPNAYVLGNGDEISILVFDESDLSMDAAIGDSGEINYSYLGALTVSGKTPVQLEKEITRALQDGYLVNPSVNVTITQYRPFFINGEVRNPGSYSYQPGLTLDKAIALAGGLTDRASSRRMFVIRAKAADQDKKRIRLSSQVGPGDVIEINEGFF